MVFDVVTGVGVHEYGQPASVRIEPRDQRIELRRVESKLTTPARVRPDEFLMHAAHSDAETCGSFLAQSARLLDCFLVEVDVCVIARVLVLRPPNARPQWVCDQVTFAAL